MVLLCWNDVIQPGGKDAVEKSVKHKHDKTASDGKTRNLEKICLKDMSPVSLKIAMNLSYKLLRISF